MGVRFPDRDHLRCNGASTPVDVLLAAESRLTGRLLAKPARQLLALGNRLPDSGDRGGEKA
jgi:hypothetical protein